MVLASFQAGAHQILLNIAYAFDADRMAANRSSDMVVAAVSAVFSLLG